jgi:hypothetical protein
VGNVFRFWSSLNKFSIRLHYNTERFDSKRDSAVALQEKGEHNVGCDWDNPAQR